MFGSWLNGIDKITKSYIRIGVAAFLWAIWNCRNDVVFNKTQHVHYLQVIHKALYWMHLWAFLLPSGQRGRLATGCARLTAVVRAISCQPLGWLHARRIDV